MDIQYLKRIGTYLLLAVISVLLIFYALYHAFNGFIVSSDTLVCKMATRRETLTMNAYIFREEEVLVSGTAGDVNYLVSDGTKVRVDDAVADVYSTGGADIRSQIIEIDRNIDLLKNSSLGNNILISDTENIDRQISELFSQIRAKTEEGNIEYVLRKKDDLLILLNRRKVILHSVTDAFSEQISLLTAQKKALTDQLTQVSETVSSPRSGYFYSSADGYETVFKSSKLSVMTLDEFYDMIVAEPQHPAEDMNEIGKLVTDYVWYIACEADYDMLRYFSTNKNYSVIFPYNSDCELSMALQSIVSQTDDPRAVLIFKTGVMPENFNYLRMQSVDIVQFVHTGFRIPVSAVRIIDGVRGVFVMNGNTVKFKKIQTIYESDGYFIASPDLTIGEDGIEPLKLNDIIMINGKDLYDGKIIG